ncbi:MAG: hypothetical protein A2Y59_05790 [Chloroflexi bacterium RBG_13_52_14]|nr:MAG: hypothetical protein A2Y59_05790 [Chloroflexi bacterium RBG_13_52_14]
MAEETREPESQTEVHSSEATTDLLQAKIVQLEQTIASRDNELSTLKDSLSGAVVKYRAALLDGMPDVPGDLVKGTTIEEIDSSLEQARGIVAKVKQQLESEAEAKRVPAGAPQRTPQDLSALTPAEKIAYALSKS